ncbi:chromosome segregation protein [Actinophytocola gossypii]|uniref:chromosome segregation protein n=1 Tax=Actinophytocola gossypii TaxID=2812003 RepID=UPI0021A9313E|nr:chromosome segregation protein [Actinophytocola gossypii]
MALGEERDLVPLGAGFDITKRGYSRVQVEEHLEQLDGQLKLLAADRNAAAAQAAELTAQLEVARSTIDDLRGQVERLSLPPTTMAGLSERLQRMLRLAQEERDETKAKADAEAEHIRAKAEADAAELRGQYERQLKELDERRNAMEAEHKSILEKARAEAADIVSAAEAEATRLDKEGEQRRTAVEEDFEIAMASRRTESMRALASQEATSKSEAERRVREATEEANRRRHDARTEATARLQEATDEAERRVREATEEANRRIAHAAQRVNALRQLRSKVAHQLQSARDLVTDAHESLELASPAFEPLPEEKSDKPTPGPRPVPGPPKEAWEADADAIPDDVARAETKRIARKP